jgi:hypothetical protein
MKMIAYPTITFLSLYILIFWEKTFSDYVRNCRILSEF